MRGQRVNHGSSLTEPLLSSLHTVNQHSYRPPRATSTQLHLFFADQLHTHIHTHTRVFCIEQSSREDTNHCSFNSMSFPSLVSNWGLMWFLPMCGCVSVCPAIIFIPLSDSHRKKGRERAQRNKNVKGIARKAHGQWRIRGRKGREWERRDGAVQLLWALWGSNCLLLWESGNSTPPTGGLVTWWEWKKGRKTQRRSEGGAQRCRERNGRTGKRKTGWIVNIKTGSPQYEWVI